MPSHTLPPGTYELEVVTPQRRQARGEDLRVLQAEIIGEGGERAGIVVLGLAEGDEMSGWPPVLSKRARRRWECLLEELGTAGAVITLSGDREGTVVSVQVVLAQAVCLDSSVMPR